MKVIQVQEIHGDPKGYNYGISFVNNKSTFRYFNTYSQAIGKLSQKQYDKEHRYWKIFRKDLPYVLNIESDIQEKMTPTVNIPNENIFEADNVQQDIPSWGVMTPSVVSAPSTKTQKMVTIPTKVYKPEEYEDIGKDLKLQPYPYQKELIKFCVDHPETLLVASCGAGKGCIAIGTLLELRKAGQVTGPAAIVAKASLKYQLCKEVAKFSDLDAIVVQTFAQLKKNEEAFNAQFKGHDVYVLNYESLRDPMIKKKMHKLKLQFMLLDEAQYIKDDTTKRAKAVHEFSYIPHKIEATATPVQKNPMDLFSLFKFLKPDLFPKKTEFGNRYVQWVTYGTYIRKPVGARNELELNKKIAPYMIVKTKEEISKQLPSLVVSQRTCVFPTRQQERSNELLDILQKLHDQEQAISLQLAQQGAKTSDALKAIEGKIMMYQTFAQELADDELLLQNSEQGKGFITGECSEKTNMCMDLVREILESGEKVCIFSKYMKYQDILTERLQKEFKDIKIAYVNGKISAKQRYEEVYTKFTNDDDYKILLMTDAGAEGISLGKCQYIIEMDLADSYAVQTQRHGRIERADSTHKTVYVYQLLTENSYDDIAQKIVKKKERFDSSIIRGEEIVM